jgi:hypothetical protein
MQLKLSGTAETRRYSTLQDCLVLGLMRGYVTVIAAGIALMGWTSWTVVAIVTALGAAVDIYRNFSSPELSADLGGYLIRCQAEVASADKAALARMRRGKNWRLSLMFGAPIGYVAMLLLAEWLAGGDALAPILKRADILADISRWVMPNIEHHPAQIAARGREARAVLVGHVYAVSTLVLVVMVPTLIVFTHDDFVGAIAACQGKLPMAIKPKRLKRPVGMALGILAFSIVMYGFFASVLPVEESGGGFRKYDVDVRNFPLVMYAGMNPTFCIFFVGAYSLLLMGRAQAATGAEFWAPPR